MTQAEFNELPGLLSRAQFQAVTGMNHHDLYACARKVTAATPEAEMERIRARGQLPVFHARRRNGYGKYYKRDAARIAGFKL
jgi:hypothetical protein